MRAVNKILTTGDIASYCNVHLRTVIRWLEKGRLKGYKLPGRGNNRIETSDFIQFLRENNMPIPEALTDSNRRVMIVDDDAQMAATIQRILHRAKYETQIASDGFQAGTQLTAFNPALMTLDLKMPNIDGLAMLNYLKREGKHKDLKIIVISAADDSQLEAAKQAGADIILRKPFEKEVLLESVGKLLE